MPTPSPAPRLSTELEQDLHHALLVTAGTLNLLAARLGLDEETTEVRFTGANKTLGVVTLGQALTIADDALGSANDHLEAARAGDKED